MISPAGGTHGVRDVVGPATGHRIGGLTPAPFTARPGEHLLAAIERERVMSVEIGCRGGGCGVCRVQVMSGTYTSRRMSRAHVSEADEMSRIVLACRITPTSDLIVTSKQRAGDAGVIERKDQ